MCRTKPVVDMQRELVERAIGGDRDAFSDLVRASLSRQYAVATLILRDGDRAQDAVQEALVSAWRGLSALRDPDAWEAWLHRLTVRACLQQARRDKRRQPSLNILPTDTEHKRRTKCIATMARIKAQTGVQARAEQRQKAKAAALSPQARAMHRHLVNLVETTAKAPASGHTTPTNTTLSSRQRVV